MTRFVLGRYVAYDTPLHRMDPRGKIIALIALMIAVFWGFGTYAMTFLVEGVLFGFIIVLMIVAHVNFRQLFGSLKTMWFIIIFLLIVNVFVPSQKTMSRLEFLPEIAFSIGTFPIYWTSILQSLKIILRLIMMISLTMILTASTRPLDLTYALEWFMTPLKLVRFPAHEVAMTISIALRFIPTLLDETERIMKAQESRGVDFRHGKLRNRLRAVVSLIVPLFVSAFQRSEELADAMEARGYDPRAKRTRYRKLRWTFFDTVSLLLSLALMCAAIVISSMNWTLLTASFLPWFLIGVALLITLLIAMGMILSSLKRRKAA